MERKPHIEHINGKDFLILTDMGKFLATKRLCGCNFRPVELDDFQIKFSLEEIHGARFSVSPKGNGFILSLETVSFGKEKYLISETVQDIECLVKFKLQTN